MTVKKPLSFMQILGIMALFFTSMGVAAVSPAMAKFAAHFPNNNYALISTFPSLFIVPTTLWAGSVAGKKIKYRTLSLVGIILFLVGGVLPFFITSSFWFIIFCRGIFGIGAGLRNSLGNALVIQMVPEEKKADYLGYGTLVMNAGGIAFQMAGGALAEIQWNYTFLAYLFGVLCLLLYFFQPEPELQEVKQETKKAKGKLPVPAIIIGLFFFIYSLLNYPVMMNMSLLFEARNAGGATVAATALSLYTVGGCVTGLLFGRIFSIFKRFTITLGFLVAALGASLLFFGTNVIILSAGSTLIGMGFSILSPAGYALVSRYVAPEQSALGVAICMALNSLGGFICPYYLNIVKAFFGEFVVSAIGVQGVCFLIFAVLFVIYNPYKAKEI